MLRLHLSSHIRLCHPQCYPAPPTDFTSNSTLHQNQTSAVFRPSCPHSVFLYTHKAYRAAGNKYSSLQKFLHFTYSNFREYLVLFFSLLGPKRISTLHHQHLSIWSPSDSDSQVPVRSSLKVSQLLFSKLVGQVKSKCHNYLDACLEIRLCTKITVDTDFNSIVTFKVPQRQHSAILFYGGLSLEHIDLLK